MKGESRVVIRYAAYGVVTLLLTVYFMFLTFPFSKLQSRLLPRLEAALSLRITVQEIRASPLLWLTLLDVQVFPQTGERTPLLEITECKVRPSLLDLIIGRPSLRVRTALLGGTLAGKVVRRKGNLDMAFSWKGIQPARHPLLSTGETPRVDAVLSGDLRLRMEGRNWIAGEGGLSLDIAQGSIQGLQVQGFTLPQFQGLNGTGKITLEKRKASLDSFTLTSDEATVSLDGSIDLSPRLASSRLNLKGRLKLAGPLEAQYQPMLSGFLRNQDADGFFGFSLRGTLGTPRFSS